MPVECHSNALFPDPSGHNHPPEHRTTEPLIVVLFSRLAPLCAVMFNVNSPVPMGVRQYVSLRSPFSPAPEISPAVLSSSSLICQQRMLEPPCVLPFDSDV